MQLWLIEHKHWPRAFLGRGEPARMLRTIPLLFETRSDAERALGEAAEKTSIVADDWRVSSCIVKIGDAP